MVQFSPICDEMVDVSDADADVKLRQINCELNPLTRSDGSALLTQGETAVLASMYGPIEAKLQNLQIDNAVVDVYYRTKAGFPTIQDRLRESIIKSTCGTAILTALHPRTAITLQVQEMEDRSGLEACAVNACCLALLIGGVAMKFTIAAVHCIIDKNNELILDPDHRQANGALADFTFVFDSIKKNIVAVSTSGKFQTVQYNDAFTISKAASENIFRFYKNIIANIQVNAKKSA